MANGTLREGTCGLNWSPPCAVRRIDAVMADNKNPYSNAERLFLK